MLMVSLVTRVLWRIVYMCRKLVTGLFLSQTDWQGFVTDLHSVAKLSYKDLWRVCWFLLQFLLYLPDENKCENQIQMNNKGYLSDSIDFYIVLFIFESEFLYYCNLSFAVTYCTILVSYVRQLGFVDVHDEVNARMHGLNGEVTSRRLHFLIKLRNILNNAT